MEREIAAIREVHGQVIGAVNKFAVEKREEVVFDKWSLKDVVSHLNTWMEHDLLCLESLRNGMEPYWEPSIDEFNARGVERRKSWSWEKVYEELVDLSERLVEVYETMSTSMWNQSIWKGRDQTPKRFVEDDIKHWKEEHLEEIMKRL